MGALWKLVSITAILTVSLSAFAEDNHDSKAVCGASQPEMNECAARESKKADQELNLLYQKLYQSEDKESQVKLKEAELAWISGRHNSRFFLSRFQ